MSNSQDSSPASAVVELPVSPAPERKRSAAVPLALFSLLIAAAALGISGWNWQLQHESAAQSDIGERVAALEALTRRAPDTRIPEALRNLEQDRARLGGLDARVDMLDSQTEALTRRVAEFDSIDRGSWALAQAAYLEQLANQSLLTGRQVHAALGLLGAADEVLRSLDDPALHAARAALAVDLANLRKVAALDVEGLYLRLAALGDETERLALQHHALPPVFATAAGAAEPSTERDWRGRLLALLGRFFVVTRRDVPAVPVMSVAEEHRLRMALRLGIEQAKLALLAAQARVYRESLGGVRQLAGDWLAADDGGVRAFIEEVDSLIVIDIAPALPDISGSLRALRASTPAGVSASLPPEVAPADPPEAAPPVPVDEAGVVAPPPPGAGAP